MSLYPYKVGCSLFRLGVCAGVALLRAVFRSKGVGIEILCSFHLDSIGLLYFPFGHYGLPAHSEAEQDAHYEQNDCVECDDCVPFCDFPFFVFHNNEF